MTAIKPIPVHSDVFNSFSSAILLNLECRLPRSHETWSTHPRAFQRQADPSVSHLGCLTAIMASLCLPIEWAPNPLAATSFCNSGRLAANPDRTLFFGHCPDTVKLASVPSGTALCESSLVAEPTINSCAVCEKVNNSLSYRNCHEAGIAMKLQELP
jgi:hypothetical protein